MDHCSLVPILLEYQLWAWPVVHEAGAVIHLQAEVVEQVPEATGEAPQDVGIGNGVAAVGHPFSHPQSGHLRVGKGQINQFHPPAFAAEPLDQPQVGAPGEGGFKGEAVASLDANIQLAENDAAGGQQLPLRGEGGEAGGDQVSIDEIGATDHQRQEIKSEGGFASTVGTREDPTSGWSHAAIPNKVGISLTRKRVNFFDVTLFDVTLCSQIHQRA